MALESRIVHMGEAPRVAVLTFATNKNERPFNDYSERIVELGRNSKEFELDFCLYTFSDLKRLIAGSKFEVFPFFRRGVGGWFWKPIIILDLLEKNIYDFIIYMDADCKILQNPNLVIQNLPSTSNLAGFKMKAEIANWTSPRVLKRFEAKSVSSNPMWTAGLLIIRNSDKTREELKLWQDAMSNPLNLFDLPFENNASRHRHDQSILSILVAQEKVKIYDLGSGFYSEGIESTVDELSLAWISTGVDSRKKNVVPLNMVSRLRNQYNYRSIRLTRYTFWVHYFLRNLLKRKR